VKRQFRLAEWGAVATIVGAVVAVLAFIGLQPRGDTPSPPTTPTATPTPTTTGVTTTGEASAPEGGQGQSSRTDANFQVAYANKHLILPNTDDSYSGNCGDGAFVDFSVPRVVGTYEGDLFLQTSCSPRGLTLTTEGDATASARGVNSPSGCQNAIDQAPISYGETIRLGDRVCVKSPNGVIAYFKWTKLSGGNAEILINGWRVD
jgi:hypothetical protein